MLRKRLIIRLGVLVIGFVTGAVVAIALLQGLLSRIELANRDSTALLDGIQAVHAAVAVIESPRTTAGPRPAQQEADARRLSDSVEQLAKLARSALPGEEWIACLSKLRDELPAYIAELRASADSGAAPGAPPTGLGAASLHADLLNLERLTRAHVGDRQSEMASELRWLIIGLTVAALVVTNIAIIVLLRVGAMIVGPVRALIEGARQLAAENFRHRIDVRQHDEFDELAHALNTAAAQLGASEERKLEALRHLSVTLNHEINNAIGTIELQLHRLNRRMGDDPQNASYLSDIHQNLGRVARTIASLREVRRIVLTDYLPGQMMLDLPRSTAAESPAAGPPTPASRPPEPAP